MAFDIKPGRGSERVKAWVYAILNPLIDSFRRETELLKTGNLSWRVHSRRCEYIRPVAELIDFEQRPNLEDFLAENPTFGERFDEHDSAVAGIEQAAARFVQGLLQSKLFQEQVAECLSTYESQARTSNPTYPELVGHTRERAAEYIAEYLVNNTKSLPRHYVHYAFWESFAPEFNRFKERQTFAARDESANKLRNVSGHLRIDLETLRLTLCREFDIPAAPIEPPRGTPAENASLR
jgi:hypothetical protein